MLSGPSKASKMSVFTRRGSPQVSCNFGLIVVFASVQANVSTNP